MTAAFLQTATALPVASAPGPAPTRASAAVERLVSAPILPTLLRLALPLIAVLVIQTLVTIAETYFVGLLGTDALAGVSLVFPVFMLMTMMSNGGMGGGVSSAVARALGGGRKADADALVAHAVLLAVGFGLAFTAAVVGGSGRLYRALGGEGAALLAAQQYSAFVFGSAVLIWTVNLMAATLRGAGDVKTPALVTLGGAVVVVPLSPALIFGVGPIPRLGVAGAGVAIVIYYALATLVLAAYLRSSRSPVRLAWTRPQWRLFKDILGVGGLSAIGTVQANVTVAIFTGFAGLFGAEAIAGYGIAARLDYLQIPLLFGLGTATVTVVGTNIGAGRYDRARRAAWTAALLAGGVTEAIGLVAAVWPHAWLGLFTSDAQVLAIGSQYLRTVAPFYGVFGLGMALYFASQGAKRVTIPVLAGSVRLAIAALGGWLVIVALGGLLQSLFVVAAASSIAFGGLTAFAIALRPWGRAASRTA